MKSEISVSFTLTGLNLNSDEITDKLKIIPTKIWRKKASGLSERELILELIILLFQRKKISVGKASQLAQMLLLQFQHELATRNIPIHYDESDLE